jgi:hypothetical protein
MFRFPKDYEANTHTFIFMYNHLICTVITIAQYGVPCQVMRLQNPLWGRTVTTGWLVVWRAAHAHTHTHTQPLKHVNVTVSAAV